MVEEEEEMQLEERERRIIPSDTLEKLISPDELLERVEAFLRGEILVRQPDGTFKRKKVDRGETKRN